MVATSGDARRGSRSSRGPIAGGKRMRDWLLLAIFFGVLGCISAYLGEPFWREIGMIVVCTVMAVWEVLSERK